MSDLSTKVFKIDFDYILDNVLTHNLQKKE